MVEDWEWYVGLFYKYKIQKKISWFSAAANAFTNSSDNYRTSVLKDHSISKLHVQACAENQIQKGTERGGKYAIPKSSPLVQRSNRIKESEEKDLIKLFEIDYVIPLRGRQFTDFSNHVKDYTS